MEQKRKIIPPVYFVLSLAAMALLHFLFPIKYFLAPPYSYVGGLWLITGIGLSAAASQQFQKAGTPVVPFERATTLVTSGLYKFTRNPMYLGMVLMLVGAALLLGSVSVLLPIVAFTWAVDRNFIQGEERFLEELFGEQYQTYKQRVRRWV